MLFGRIPTLEKYFVRKNLLCASKKNFSQGARGQNSKLSPQYVQNEIRRPCQVSSVWEQTCMRTFTGAPDPPLAPVSYEIIPCSRCVDQLGKRKVLQPMVPFYYSTQIPAVGAVTTWAQDRCSRSYPWQQFPMRSHCLQ